MAFPPRRSDPIPIDVPGPERLNSWKEIAARLSTSVRTAQRWEQTENLPVHRHRHVNDSTVYAYRHELDQWLATRGVQQPLPEKPRFRSRYGVLAAIVALLFVASALIFSASSPLVPPQKTKPFATSLSAQMFPAWSPDGAHIAFIGARSNRRQVMVQPTGGMTAVPLTQEDLGLKLRQFLFWSADSHWVYYFSSGGLWRVPSKGGEPLLVQDHADAGSLSPDGRTLVTLGVSAKREWRIYVASPPEAERRPYDPPPFVADSNLQWPAVAFAPDGKKILAAVNLSGRGPEYWMLPWPPSPPSRVLQDLERFGGLVYLSWLPDSRHVVFLVRRRRELFIGDTETGKFWMAENLDRWPGFPSASPDGRRIAYQVQLSHTDVVEVPFDGSEVRPLLESPVSEEMAAVCSRTGRMVYLSDRRGYWELWTRPVTGGADVPIATRIALTAAAPALSPDGSRVAFRAALNPATSGILTASVSGQDERRVQMSDPLLFAPSWSPDGRWLAFLRRERLVKLRVDSDEPPVDLAESVLGATHTSLLPEWSPTGEWIAFGDKQNNLAIVSPDGRNQRVIGGCGPVSWSQDGRTLYQFNYDKQAIVAIDVATGAQRTVRRVGDLLPFASSGPARRVSLTPGGKSLVYSVQRPREEIWILDDFRPPHPWYARLRLPGY